MEKHDSHYRKVEKSGIEPIVVMEDIIIREGIPLVVLLNIALAVKYLLRIGIKEPEQWEKDLDKAINFLHRAKNGQWR